MFKEYPEMSGGFQGGQLEEQVHLGGETGLSCGVSVINSSLLTSEKHLAIRGLGREVGDPVTSGMRVQVGSEPWHYWVGGN